MTKQQQVEGGEVSVREGWRRWSAAEGADAVMRWRASGLSASEFGAREGISENRLYRWRQRLDVSDASSAPVVPTIEAPTATAAPVGFVRVAARTGDTRAATSAGPTSVQSAPAMLRMEHEGVVLVVRDDIAPERLADVVHALMAGARRC